MRGLKSFFHVTFSKSCQSGVKCVIIIKCRLFRNSSDVMSLSQVLNNLNTSETSETMEAASLKEPSSSLESTRPFPEIFDVNGFSIINVIAEFNQLTEKQ